MRGLDSAEITKKEILKPLLEIKAKILPFVKTVWLELDKACRDGQRILFEGAQGAMLDIDHGTYPFVTSSNTIAGAASVGSGHGAKQINFNLGITKAYTCLLYTSPSPRDS